jgi:hypothetical protein
MVLALEAPLIN